MYLLFRHFSNTCELSPIHVSSQNFYVNDLGMTRPIFGVPGKTNSPEWRYMGFGLNILVAEEQQSVSCRHAEILFVENNNSLCLLGFSVSLTCRHTQYRERPKIWKLSRNGFRMDDKRNRDWENYRTGPRSIFSPLPDLKAPQKITNSCQNLFGFPRWDYCTIPGLRTVGPSQPKNCCMASSRHQEEGFQKK